MDSRCSQDFKFSQQSTLYAHVPCNKDISVWTRQAAKGKVGGPSIRDSTLACILTFSGLGLRTHHCLTGVNFHIGQEQIVQHLIEILSNL